MKDLLKFWEYINENYDEDYIEEALENNEIDINALTGGCNCQIK